MEGSGAKVFLPYDQLRKPRKEEKGGEEGGSSCFPHMAVGEKRISLPNSQ